MGSDPERRSIDWDQLVGSDVDFGVQSPGPSPRLLSAILSAADELAAYSDKDTVLRRAVELARDRIGLERVAIYLEDDKQEQMLGTWGTGLSGETTDEHHLTYRYGGMDRDVHENSVSGAARWLVFSDAPLLAQMGDEPYVAGRGWIAVTPIRSPLRTIGVMFNDTATSGRPINDAQQTRVAVFCTLLGTVLEKHISPESSLPGEGRGQQPSIQRAVLALREDASLDGKALAERVGISEGHLNRQFRKTMGVSLVDYRNRLRIERFLGAVEGGESNLHHAAETAGFGSYAQFHRVFRALLGASPREYLTGRRDDEPSS